MAALTSGSWTVQFLHATGATLSDQARNVDTSILGRHKVVQAIMITASGEVPALGIPWPDKGKFGFVRNLDTIQLVNARPRTAATVGPITASGTHVLFQINVTGQRVRVFNTGSASGTAQRAIKQFASTLTLSGGQRLYVTAWGW